MMKPKGVSVERFKRVSEWVAKGAMKTGFYLFSANNVANQSDKAVALKCTRFTSSGNAYEGVAWLPKSVCQQVEDDFYDDTKGTSAWLVPEWLTTKKTAEGFYLLG